MYARIPPIRLEQSASDGDGRDGSELFISL